MDKPQSESLQPPPGGPLEALAAFVDGDGVLRRSSSVTRRMVLRGASVGKAEYLLCAPPSSCSTDRGGGASLEGERDWTRRRSQLVCEIRHVKHELLVASNARLQQRTQRWYEASQRDPDAETTSAHTAECPSPRARAFVDAEGNVRRKKDGGDGQPPAVSGGPASPVMRPSVVLEFIQAVLD